MRDFTSGQDEITGTRLTLLLEITKTSHENMFFKKGTQYIGYQVMKDNDPGNGTNEECPTIAPAYCVEKVSILQYRKREPRQNLVVLC